MRFAISGRGTGRGFSSLLMTIQPMTGVKINPLKPPHFSITVGPLKQSLYPRGVRILATWGIALGKPLH